MVCAEGHCPSAGSLSNLPYAWRRTAFSYESGPFLDRKGPEGKVCEALFRCPLDRVGLEHLFHGLGLRAAPNLLDAGLER